METEKGNNVKAKRYYASDMIGMVVKTILWIVKAAVVLAVAFFLLLIFFREQTIAAVEYVIGLLAGT